ncbi:MAG: DUF1302 family protein [Deltaproteobacteria bacterium]|nr:DUF1302 family protein [Deltaproteobacteria bacterium]
MGAHANGTNLWIQRWLNVLGAVILVLFLFVDPAQSFKFDTGNPDMQASWDNTIKFSTAYRLGNKSDALTGDINQDDGDRAFNPGFISSRFDLLSEFDLKYKNYGIRLSGAGWYDPVYYHANNDNNSASTANAYSVPHNEFTRDSRRLMGLDAELLDAFAYGSTNIDSSKVSFRVGQFAQLWGESMFFGNNGIANGMAPIDVIKAMAVPNSQFKEIIRPVPQVGGQWQISSQLSLGAYYQFGWKKDRLPAVDSYFGNLDFFGEGGERLFVGPPLIPGGGPQAFYRGTDIEGNDQGQGGFQVRFRCGEYDFGFYAIRYHEKTPQIYFYPGVDVNPATGQIGKYALVYPEGIQSYGASASTTFGIVNLAGEVSYRYHTPLVSDAATVSPGQQADNSGHPLYAVGNSLHAQVSTLTSFGPSFISNEATLLGEIAWNYRLEVIDNPGMLDPNTTRNGLGIRLVYEPTYRQVISGLDISIPIGGSFFPLGTSSVVPNFGPDKGGDFNLGIKGTYLDVWRLALIGNFFYGSEGTFLDKNNHFSFAQSYSDRNYVSLSLTRTF